jgi:hypothetical protein
MKFVSMESSPAELRAARRDARALPEGDALPDAASLAALVAPGAGGPAAPQPGPSATDLLGMMQALQPPFGTPSGPVTVGHLLQLAQQLDDPRGAAGQATPPSGSITPDQLRALMPPLQPQRPPGDPAGVALPRAGAAADPAPNALPRNALDPLGTGDAVNILDRIGSAGGSAAPPAARSQLDPNGMFAKFFDQNYAPAARVATALGVDPASLLGVAALESKWGTSNQAQTKGNPFGYIPKVGQPTTFLSPDQAWQQWAKTFGPRVQGVGSDAQRFLDSLQTDNRFVYGPTNDGGKYLGMYNSTDPHWSEEVGNTVQSVRDRLPQWSNNPDALR